MRSRVSPVFIHTRERECLENYRDQLKKEPAGVEERIGEQER